MPPRLTSHTNCAERTNEHQGRRPSRFRSMKKRTDGATKTRGEGGQKVSNSLSHGSRPWRCRRGRCGEGGGLRGADLRTATAREARKLPAGSGAAGHRPAGSGEPRSGAGRPGSGGASCGGGGALEGREPRSRAARPGAASPASSGEARVSVTFGLSFTEQCLPYTPALPSVLDVALGKAFSFFQFLFVLKTVLTKFVLIN